MSEWRLPRRSPIILYHIITSAWAHWTTNSHCSFFHKMLTNINVFIGTIIQRLPFTFGEWHTPPIYCLTSMPDTHSTKWRRNLEVGPRQDLEVDLTIMLWHLGPLFLLMQDFIPFISPYSQARPFRIVTCCSLSEYIPVLWNHVISRLQNSITLVCLRATPFS